MAKFLAVLLEHGYGKSQCERDVITRAGGELIDVQDRPLEDGLELCRGADAILVRRVVVTSDMIRTFHRCRVLVRFGIGTDNIDVDAATEAGIIVGNVPSYCLDEVSSHAIALLLDCVRDVTGTHRKMVQGDWEIRRASPLHRLAGRTLGLVGLGQIGSAVARKLEPWGVRVIASDPFAKESHARSLNVRLMSLEDLCAASDFISVHVPLLPETFHLIGPRQLELMKPGTCLVNTARGPVLDTRAMLDALDGGRLARAALDVFEEEPLPPESPLRRHPRVVLTDHMAWYSEESQVELQTTAAEVAATVCTGGLPGSLSNPLVLQRLGRYAEWKPAECMRWQLARMKALGAPLGPGSFD